MSLLYSCSRIEMIRSAIFLTSPSLNESEHDRISRLDLQRTGISGLIGWGHAPLLVEIRSAEDRSNKLSTVERRA